MPRRKVDQEEPWVGNVPHGSPAHATLLGMGDEAAIEELDPKDRARREKQLNAVPTPMSDEQADRKRPVNTDEYGPGEPILEGFVRRGRR